MIKRKLQILNNKLNLALQDILFPDFARIRHIPQHLDMINLGSRPAKFAIDYKAANANGFNLAIAPQTIEYDFRVLKNYYSYLDYNGPKLVALVLCPFSLLKTRYTEADGKISRDHRYYPILHHALINNYQEATYRRIKRHPAMYAFSITSDLKGLLSKRTARQLAVESNLIGQEGMEHSADTYIDRWKQEFGIENLASVPYDKINAAIEFNKNILRQIKEFCNDRDLKLVAVVPPLSEALLERIPKTFLEQAMLKPLQDCGITTLDYSSANPDIKNFTDALCLNASGRRIFTNTLISDLKQKGLK